MLIIYIQKNCLFFEVLRTLLIGKFLKILKKSLGNQELRS